MTLLVSGNHSDFQIPNNPGQAPAFNDMGRSTFDSAKLDENQSEDSAYEILTYQKKVDDFNFQASVFNRYSSILFRPDNVGDLIFNGVASRVDRAILSNGVELDSSYKLNDQHTIRAGLIFTEQHATIDTATLVFPVDANGNQTSTTPQRIVDNHDKYGYFYGFYLQDEWKPFEQLTINFGGRLDFVNAFAEENQLSPRINIVYTPWTSTTLHAGYARYFTPPPLEAVPESTIAKFTGTTNESAITKDSAVTSERAHYFDVGVTQKIMEGFNVGLDGFTKAHIRFSTKASSEKHSSSLRSITSAVKFIAASSRRAMITARFPPTKIWLTSGRAARMSARRNFYSIRTSSPSSKRTGSSSTTISALPVPPGSPIRGTIGKRPSMDFTATACGAVSPTRRRIIPTKRSTLVCSAGSRSRRRLPSRSASMSSTFSTQSMSCATAAGSVWARRSSASAAASTERSPTIFKLSLR